MTLSVRALNRATLARQLLLRREPLGAIEGVRRVVALQAQEPASPYLALWNRIDGFDPTDLDTAFAEGAVVKASLMRMTLHAVHATDYPAFHRAMLHNLRASRLNDERFRGTGMTTADADRLVQEVLEFLATPRTTAEVESLLVERVGDAQPRLWWALKMYSALHHAPTGGPWSFGSPVSFVAAPTTSPTPSEDDSVKWLARRYLEAFGPASERDFAQHTMLRKPLTGPAFESLAAELEILDGPDGQTLFDVPGGLRPGDDVEAPPRLLPMWESMLLAYVDRSRVLPEEYRRVVIRRNGDVLPTVLVDGYVAGAWRSVEGGIEVVAFRRLDGAVWEGLAVEAAALRVFLANRQPAVYRRYARWFADLPGEEVRVLE